MRICLMIFLMTSASIAAAKVDRELEAGSGDQESCLTGACKNHQFPESRERDRQKTRDFAEAIMEKHLTPAIPQSADGKALNEGR